MKGNLFLLSLLLIGVYWQWFLPGPKVANDFPAVPKEVLSQAFDLPRVWTEQGAEGLGEYITFFLWSYPLSFVTGFLATMGLSFQVLERVLLMIPFLIVGIFGMWKLSKDLNLSKPAKFVTTFFYLTNTYILIVIDGGQMLIALAYAFFPISFVAVKKGLEGSTRDKVLAALSVAILGFFDLRFVMILFLLSLIFFLFEFWFADKKNRVLFIKQGLVLGFVSLIIFLGLNAYWLIPLKISPITSQTYTFFTQTSFESFANLGHSLSLLAPHWYENIFGRVSSLKVEFLLISALIFLAPILRSKNKIVGFWMIVALVGVFLGKGASEPFPEGYKWLFNNIPGFSLFRDSSKFFFLVALSYTVLLGFTVDGIIQKIKTLKIKIIFFTFIIFYLLFLVRPVWLGWMTGTFSQSPYQKEYQNLSNILQKDSNFSRVFWVPTFPPLGYSSKNHPRVEASRLVQKRTFAQGTVGTYEIFNFLREAPFMGEIFDIASVGYIVYPNLDPRRDNLHPDNIKYYYTFSNQLSTIPWLSKISDSPIPLWRVNEHQDRFFITPNVWLVIGSDTIYNQTIENAQLKLSKNALVFIEEQAGLGKRIEEIPQAKIILNNKSMTDLAASFIHPSNLIFPAKNLDPDPDESGWWKREAKDLIRWRDFLQTKYGIDNQDFDLGGGWAVGEGNLELRIKNLELRENRVLLARVLESTRSGQLKFYQSGDLIGEINTRKEGNNVRWFEVGEMIGEEELVIESQGDINVVNSLAILDNGEWFKLQNKAQSLQGRVSDFDAKNALQAESSVKYQQINPTKYKVSVKNLTDPGFLVFSQTYDGFWKMDGQKSLPVYSLLNGFRVEKDGEYLVEFEVQKYVYPGLIISGSTLIFTILLLFKTRKPRKFRI